MPKPVHVFRYDLLSCILTTCGAFWAYMEIDHLWALSALGQILAIFFFAVCWYFVVMGVIVLSRCRIRRVPRAKKTDAV